MRCYREAARWGDGVRSRNSANGARLVNARRADRGSPHAGSVLLEVRAFPLCLRGRVSRKIPAAADADLRPVRPRANLGGSPISDRDNSRNSAACTRLGSADFQEDGTRVWGPPVGPSCVHEARSVGRVPRAAQHAGVGGVERRATVDERQDVVERQVARRVRRMLGTIARAHVAVLADVTSDHPLGHASPSRVRMDVMVGTDARQPWVLAASTPRAAGDHTADRAELHALAAPCRSTPPGCCRSRASSGGRAGTTLRMTPSYRVNHVGVNATIERAFGIPNKRTTRVRGPSALGPAAGTGRP